MPCYFNTRCTTLTPIPSFRAILLMPTAWKVSRSKTLGSRRRWCFFPKNPEPRHLPVFNDFTVRVSAFLALIVRTAVGAFWLAEDQSCWIKRSQIRHGCAHTKTSQAYSRFIESSHRLLKLS